MPATAASSRHTESHTHRIPPPPRVLSLEWPVRVWAKFVQEVIHRFFCLFCTPLVRVKETSFEASVNVNSTFCSLYFLAINPKPFNAHGLEYGELLVAIEGNESRCAQCVPCSCSLEVNYRSYPSLRVCR